MNLLDLINSAKFDEEWKKTFLQDELVRIGMASGTEILYKSLGPVLAVDGDTLAYRTAAVCETHFEGACEAILDSALKRISTLSGVSLMRIYLSGENNFRYSVGVTKPYKGNRATMVHPQFLGHCKNYLETKYKAIRVHGYEADDGIATDMVVNGAIHCGVDKDILQIPGDHFNYVKADEDISKAWISIDEEDATVLLYRQILMGDTSDNVPGLPGVGEKKAESFVTNAVDAKDQAIAAYRMVVPAKLPGVDPMVYFEEQQNLIKMVTNVPLSFDNTIFIEPNTDGFEAQDLEVTNATPRL